jgi:exosortase/archaeosortase family protein
MIPVWDFATERLHYPFQQFAAATSAWLLNGLSVPVYRQDVYVHLPNITLEVAKVCSGVNYLIAVIAIGIVVAYTSFPDLARRLALVLFATTVAILGNPVRVVVIGYLAYHGLSRNIHGPWHVLQGMTVAMAGYCALFVGASLLSRVPVRHPVAAPRPRDSAATPSARSLGLPPRWPGLRLALVAGSLLVAGGLLSPYSVLDTDVTSPERLTLPMRIGGWDGRDANGWAQIDHPVEVRPGEICRTYVSPAGGRVEVYLGRYAHPQSPAGSFIFWGDQIEWQARRVVIDVPVRGPVGVNHAVIPADRLETDVLYWYDLDGRMVASRFVAKLYHAWHVLTSLGRPPRVVALALLRRRGAAGEPEATELRAFAAQVAALLSASPGS